jgi:hypothetical protein
MNSPYAGGVSASKLKTAGGKRLLVPTGKHLSKTIVQRHEISKRGSDELLNRTMATRKGIRQATINALGRGVIEILDKIKGALVARYRCGKHKADDLCSTDVNKV